MKQQLITACVVCLGASSFALSALAATTDPKVAHDMKQALLYLESHVPASAVSTLEETVKTEPGQSDAMVWLLLGRSYFEAQLLDQAGAAVDRADSLNLEPRLKEAAWAQKFHRDFRDQYGALEVFDAPCETISFAIDLAGPTTAEKRKVLERVPGWTQKRFVRPSKSPIYLPAAEFKLGEKVVEIQAAKSVRVSTGEIAATCERMAPAALAGGGPGPADNGGGGGSKTWIWWVIGGAVVAAGGTAGILLATRKTVYDYDFKQ